MQLALYTLPPPYRDPSPVPTMWDGSYSRGTLIAVRPLPDFTPCALSPHVCALQERFPHAPVILWLDLIGRKQTAEMIVAAAARAVRGILLSALPDPEGLRSALTDPSHLSGDIAYRLRLLGFDVNASATALIDAACGHAVDCRSVQQVVRAANLDYNRLLRGLRRTDLGTPAGLYQILRLLLVAMSLQRNARGRVGDVSSRYGFYDEAALRARFRDCFGVSPSIVRGWIGWEYLLFTALRRSGLHPGSQSTMR